MPEALAPRRALVAALPSDPLRWGPDAARPLRVRARQLAADTRIVPHRHDWAQVAFSATGVLRVSAADHTYIVPPSRAVWIPPGVEHAVTVVEDAELRTLYATAFEVDPSWVVESASRRQKWIDQAQSLNIYMAGASGKKLDETYKLAWKRGLKTTYYLRTLGATSAEKSTVPRTSFCGTLD